MSRRRSSDEESGQQNWPPTLPPIRYLFEEELSRPPGPRHTTVGTSSFSHGTMLPTTRMDGTLPGPPLMGPASQPLFSSQDLQAPNPYPIYTSDPSQFSPLRPPSRMLASGHTRSGSSTAYPYGSGPRSHPLVGQYNYSDLAASRTSPDSNSQPVTSSPPKYVCTYCGKAFDRPSSLKIHVYSHTGERPFECPVEGCGRSFNVLSNMRRHARSHIDFADDVPTDEEYGDINPSAASASVQRIDYRGR